MLADPAPPSRTVPLPEGSRPLCHHRPNKPPPAPASAAAAHHISGPPPRPDAIRPLPGQTRCSHFDSQAILHTLLQPLAHFQMPTDHGIAASPTSLPSYKWRRRSLSHELALQNDNMFAQFCVEAHVKAPGICYKTQLQDCGTFLELYQKTSSTKAKISQRPLRFTLKSLEWLFLCLAVHLNVPV